MAAEHLAGDLRIPGLVGANQAKPISSEDRHQSIEQEKGGKYEKADGLQGVAQARETRFQRLQAGAWPMKYSRRCQHCFFLSHRFCQAVRPRLQGLQQDHGYKAGCEKKEPDIELRPQGYQIHRPGREEDAPPDEAPRKKGSRAWSSWERGGTCHLCAEILEN